LGTSVAFSPAMRAARILVVAADLRAALH